MNAFSRSVNGPVGIALIPAVSTVAELSLPHAGSYVVFAKAWVAYGASTGNVSDADCTLVVQPGARSDRAVVTTPGLVASEAIALNVLSTIGGAGRAVLTCSRRGGPAELRLVMLTALQVGSLTESRCRSTGPYR